MLLCQNEAFVETSHFSHALNSILSPSERKFPFFKPPLPTDCLFLYWKSSEMEREKGTGIRQILPNAHLQLPPSWEDSITHTRAMLWAEPMADTGEMELDNAPKARQLQLKSH